MKHTPILTAIVLALIPWFGTSRALAQCQVTSAGGLVGTANAMGDQFASAIATDGTTTIVGTRYDDDLGDSSGTATAFRLVGSTWTNDGTLLPTDGGTNDNFGASVAVAGVWAFVGAPGYEEVGVSPFPDIGAVYVFKRNNGIWQQTQKLVAPIPATNDQFGSAVAMSGTVAVCSTTIDGGGTLQGAAFVYRLNGSTWVMEKKLTASIPATYTFGASVAINNNLVLIGAPNETNGLATFGGAAYAFEYTGSTWVQRQRLVPTDAVASDKFGTSVAIEGDMAVIGATGTDDRGAESGSVYIFRRVTSVWSQSQKLFANDTTSSDLFGGAVSLSQNVLVIGARNKYGPALYAGAAYVFARQGNTWSQASRLIVPSATNSDYFGSSVSVSGQRVLVGAPGSDYTTFNGGRAWAYTVTCGSGSVPGDVNGNGTVNIQDLLAVIGAWGVCPATGSCPADIAPVGGDDVVNISDLLAVVSNWD